MKLPVYIGFYGSSNSGKTTLITRLIRELSAQDLKVATIKQTSNPYSIDAIGKDTWKHAQAGAGLVCFQTAVETSIIVKKTLSFEKIKKYIALSDDYDIVLVEGARQKDILKIRLDEQIAERNNTVFTFDGDINKVLTFIDKERKRKSDV